TLTTTPDIGAHSLDGIGGRSGGLASREAVALPLSPQRRRVDSQPRGSLAQCLRLRQHLLDALALELLERELVRGRARAWPASAPEQSLGKAVGSDGVAGGEDDRTLEHAHQLADVAVPAMGREQAADVGGDVQRTTTVTVDEPCEEVVGER